MQCAKQCYGPECVNSARIGSNYCSDECGLALAEVGFPMKPRNENEPGPGPRAQGYLDRLNSVCLN